MASSSAVADLGKRLLEASRKGNAEEVRQLMATGAPITTDWLGTSPLHLAAQYGHTVTAEVLLRAGVSRDGKTKVDKTPLHLAAQHGHFEIAKMLIKSGATVNQVDMLNMTPLHWAVEAHSPEICKLLMKNGATTDTRNKFGQSAMDIIKAKNYHNLTEILLCTNQGANDYINERQNNNNTNIYFESRKRARTRKFPMTAGSWTGGELQTDKDSRPRPKQARLIVEEKQPTTNINENLEERESVANGNNLSSLVDAAALVRSKAHNNISNNRISGSISGDTSQRNIPVFTDASVLDTLATLATASTQIITSGSDTIGSTGTKTASQPNSSLRPSYVTIPGIQAPVQILQANPNQPGLVTPSPVASALPAGMIQLASPLAFNIMPGGRLQVGQPVVSGAHLNIPVQMPLQTAGLPAGHFIAVNNSSNTIISQPAGTLGQSVAKQPVVTETLSSRPTSIMSAATQGATAELPQGNLPVNLPIGLVNTLVGGNVSLANIQPLPGNTSTAQSGDARFIQPKAVPVTQISLQPGMAPAQLAQAIQYANIGPGLAPIPFLPVAGLGGLQFLPQVIPTQLFNALRGSLPQAPQFHPQLANNAYTIPMSPLNLSSILPTAASLAQLPLAQQQSLAQHLQIPATPQVHSSVAQLLQPSPNQQQTIASSTPQPLNVVTQRILESPPHQQIVTLPAQGHGSIAQQLQPSANQQQPAASTQLSLNVVTQRIIEPPSQQQIVTLAPQIDGPLHQQTTSNHQDSGTLSQRVLGTQAQIVLGPGHLTQRVLGSPTQEPTVSQQMVSLGQEVQDVFGPTRSDTLEHRIHSSPTQQPIVSQIVSLGQEVQDVFGSTRSDTLEQRVHGSPTQQTVVSQPMVSLDQEVQDVLGPTRPDILEQRVVGSPTQQLNISLGQEDRNSINQSSNFVQHVSPTQQETVSFGNEAKAAVNHTQPGSLTERVLPSSIQQQLISSGQEAQSRPDSLAQRLLGSSPSDHTVSSGPEVQSLLDESRSGPLAQHVLGSSSPEQTVSLGQEIQRTLNETRPCSFGEDVLSSTTEHQMVSIGQEVESTLVQSQSDGLARGVLPSPTQQPTFTSEQDVQDPLNQTRNGNIDQYALGSPAQDVQSTLNQSDTFSRHMLTSSTQQPETSLQQEIQDPLNRPQTDTFDQHVLGSPAQDIQSTLNQSDTLSRRIHATSTQQPEISLQQDPQNPLLQPQCNTFDQRALGSPAQDVQITLAEASTLAQSVFCSASESPIVTLAQNMITSSMQPESDVTAKQTLNSSTENFGDSPNTQAFIDTFAQPPTSEQHVTSTIDPELSLSPANFADSEDKMMVPEDQTAGIVVSSDAIQSANDNNSLPVSQPEESPSSTSDSGSQVLPHLQQLVYKQLQDQTQVAESPNTALKDQLSTIEAEDDSNKDENRPKTRISQEITEEGSESTDEQTRRHASEDGQQVDLLRFLEPSTTTEEHPQEDLGDLKTQSNEEVNQLETQNEKDELKTTEEEIVLNEEELCEAGNPPTDALKQADDEQI